MLTNTYYGGFRSRTFAQILPDVSTFISKYNEIGLGGLAPEIATEASEQSNLNVLYMLLYSRYGNSHIANSDENQFLAGICARIYQYGPSWRKQVSYQKQLRSLSLDDLVQGAKVIYNRALNPENIPTSSSSEPTELNHINEQTTQNYKKAKTDGLSLAIELLKRDVTGSFINTFKDLFVQIAYPDYPLLYETEITEDEQ